MEHIIEEVGMDEQIAHQLRHKHAPREEGYRNKRKNRI